MVAIDTDITKSGRQKFLDRIDDKYGSEYVSQVGTTTSLGVKNGISDVGRVLEKSFGDMKKISKALDEISSDPGLSFKKLDSLKDSDEKAYKKFVELEKANEEVFKYARALEGTIRGLGCHAGGVLITPTPINDYFPTRIEKGRKVTLWDKDVVEQKKGVNNWHL